MSTDTINILDNIKYVRYPQDTGITILVNDVLNLHIREDNIESFEMINVDENTSRLTLTLNKDLKSSSDGNIYQGKVRLFYEKMDASLVYPNGFYVHKKPDGDFSIRNILQILKKNTGVRISEEECDLIFEDNQHYIEFKDTSIFWKGRIFVNSLEDMVYVSKELDEVLFNAILDGFEFDTSELENSP